MNANVTLKTGFLAAAVVLAGCAGTVTDTDSDLMTGAEDGAGTVAAELSSGVSIGTRLKTTTSLNLRTGAGTGYRVRLVIPAGATVTTVNRTTPVGGWYNIKYNGVTGWSYGSYLKVASSGGSSGGGSSGGSITSHNRDGAVARAKSGVGFSYWWGHAAWNPGGPTSSTKGSCYGSCPSCRHYGSKGADCSGYVAKLWQVPSSNTSLTHDWHPYSTASFASDSSLWHGVRRSSIRRGDAMNYHSGGHGHVFLFESGDGWGSMWAYEAKGCSYGIRHNIRTASSAYRGIARAGY